SPKLKAIRLYQNLLAFHKDDQDKSAFLDADLSRLQFAHAHAYGESRSSRYKEALKLFVESNPRHELSAMARHRWASVLQGEGEHVEARKIALEGKSAFPESPGGRLCHNLILEIEAKSV